jgi:hypothetical protein
VAFEKRAHVFSGSAKGRETYPLLDTPGLVGIDEMRDFVETDTTRAGKGI